MVPPPQNVAAISVDPVAQLLRIRRVQRRNRDCLVQVAGVDVPLQCEEILYARFPIETEPTMPHLPTVMSGGAVRQIRVVAIEVFAINAVVSVFTHFST